MTVLKPAWTYIGTGGVNIWAGRRQQPIAIVCHIMAGTLAACDSWFSNPAAQASANFGVGKDGTIHCYVDPQGRDAPYANGVLAKPDAAVQALLAQTGGTNPNYWSVSLEHEGQSGDTVPTAQLDASAHLAAWLIETFGIANDEAHLLGHYEFDAVNRSGCPGWSTVQWQEWEAAVNDYLGATPVPTPAPGPDVRDAITRIHRAEDELAAALENLAT